MRPLSLIALTVVMFVGGMLASQSVRPATADPGWPRPVAGDPAAPVEMTVRKITVVDEDGRAKMALTGAKVGSGLWVGGDATAAGCEFGLIHDGAEWAVLVTDARGTRKRIPVKTLGRLVRGPEAPASEWKKGPLPASTWNWGGVVTADSLKAGGFRFADFRGSHVIDVEDGSRIEAKAVLWYDNSLTLPPTEQYPK